MKKYVFISLVAILLLGCKKENIEVKQDSKTITYFYDELWSGNPWIRSADDSLNLLNIKRFLLSKNIEQKELIITNDADVDLCKSMSCPTGRRIRISILAIDTTKVKALNFYKSCNYINKILMLKVDYQTLTFEGGTEAVFSSNTKAFTIKNDYKSPGDFGNLKLYYQEINELLFDGDIIWMGKGVINFPKSIMPASNFESVLTNDYVAPENGFENIFKDNIINEDYERIWQSVQSLVKVRAYLLSNPKATVKLFLYTPSVGEGNPADWDWIIIMNQNIKK